MLMRAVIFWSMLNCWMFCEIHQHFFLSYLTWTWPCPRHIWNVLTSLFQQPIRCSQHSCHTQEHKNNERPIQYISIKNRCILYEFSLYKQGVPKKCSHVWEAITPPKMALETKVGWFFKSSGTPLSDGHWNFSFLTMGGWENRVKRE